MGLSRGTSYVEFEWERQDWGINLTINYLSSIEPIEPNTHILTHRGDSAFNIRES